MPRGKSKKGHEVIGNRNRPSERFWSKSKEKVDVGCGPQMTRRGYLAIRNGSWEELNERYRKEEKSSEWTLETKREAHEKVDFLRRVIALVGGMGRVSLSYVCPPLQPFSAGGLHLVGIDSARRRRQQKEEALQLMESRMWRQIRMESGQQDTCCAVRYQCQ